MAPPNELCIAVIHAADVLLFVAAGRDRADVMPRLADWVADQAPRHLWDEDARTLSALVSQGDVEGAVRFYFRALECPSSRIRWERQWLVLETVPVLGGRPVAALTGRSDRCRAPEAME